MTDNMIVDLDALEPCCIAQHSRTAIIYLYPYMWEVVRLGAKVLTRDGRLVKRVHPAKHDGQDVVVGILEGKSLVWDHAGRFNGPYADHPNDLYVPERYFFKDFKSHMKMSYAEWTAKFGRPHPTVKLPDNG